MAILLLAFLGNFAIFMSTGQEILDRQYTCEDRSTPRCVKLQMEIMETELKAKDDVIKSLQKRINELQSSKCNEQMEEHGTTEQPDQNTMSTETQKIARDCKELYIEGATIDGIYTVTPDNISTFQVFCDMKNGGWTLIQQRVDGEVSFDRNWTEYVNGFGNLSTDFWLGLNYIYALTREPSEIFFTITLINTNEVATALYQQFYIEDANQAFRMHVNRNGTYNEVFTRYVHIPSGGFFYHDNTKFSTKDVDNDLRSYSCSTYYDCGGYWFKDCHDFGCFNGNFHTLNINNYKTKQIARMSIKIRR